MKFRPNRTSTSIAFHGDRNSVPLVDALRRTLSKYLGEGVHFDPADREALPKALGELPPEAVADLLLEANLLLGMTEETAQRFIDSAEKSRTKLEEIHENNEAVLNELDNVLARHDGEEGGEGGTEPRAHLVAEVRGMVEALSTRNAELEQARREAEEALESREQFLANMSHEIRTPLNGILGMTQLILETELNPEQKKYLETVLSSGKGLERILNDVLDYSRLDADEMVLEIKPFDLHKLLEETIRTIRFGARSRGLETRFEIAADVPRHIGGDAVRIRQIVVNLLDNAVKFTEEGWISLVADLLDQTSPGGRRILRLVVDDSGKGIPEAKMGEIFLPFVQQDPSSTRAYGGAGLGLAIVLQLAELMGGTIRVASRLGEGSRFVVLLPFNEVEPSALDTPSASPAEERGPDYPSLPVLVVEDNDINQQVAVLAIERLGHHCTVAANGQEAVDAMRREAFPVVFMDLSMPVMDGLEATRRIREWEDPANRSYLVAMTGNAFDEDRERCYEAGMNNFLAKPFDLHQLEAVLDEAVRELGIGAGP